MHHNLKALGLAFVAVIVMGALTASASATDVFTTSDQENALLTGTSHDNKFKRTGAESTVSECTTTNFAGTVINGASELTLETSNTGEINETPHGTECASSIGKVTVHMNGCHFKLTGNTTGSDSGTDATVSIECPGAPITITAPLNMRITIPSQTPTSGGITYTNLPNHSGGAAITIKTTVTGITYNCHGGFPCAVAGWSSHGNNLDFAGTMTLTAYTDIEGLPTPITEGPRVGISVS